MVVGYLVHTVGSNASSKNREEAFPCLNPHATNAVIMLMT